MIRKTSAALLAVILSLSTLAACGDTAENTSQGGDTPSGANTAVDDSSETTTEDPGPALELPEAD